MSAEQNKAVFRRFMEDVVSKGNPALIDEMLSPDYVDHEEPPPGIPSGREGTRQFISVLRGAFPDLKSSVDDVVAEGNKVAGRSTWTGTHQGEFIGISPTGKRVSFGSIDIVRFVDGIAVEHWGATDNMGLMQQLGAIPAQE